MLDNIKPFKLKFIQKAPPREKDAFDFLLIYKSHTGRTDNYKKRNCMKMILLFILPILMIGTSISSCTDSGKVYICTGPKSKVYHKSEKCKGLNRCSRDVKAISLEEAKKMNRRECKICY